MNRILFSFIIGITFGVIFPLDLQAGCGNIYHRHHAVIAQPVLLLHSVGDELRIEAAVEKALAKRAQQPGTLQQRVNSAIGAKCLRCHQGTEAAGGIDFRWKVDDYAFRRTVEMLGESIDVPEKMAGVIKSLSAEDKGNITSELMKLPAKREEQAQPPEPEPGVLR